MNDKASVRNVFSVRNFRLVFFGALVSEIGSVLYSFAVSFLILDLTGNNAFLQGLYLALGSVVLLLVTPIGGILSDRYNKSRIMAVCDGLSGIVIILATLGMYLFTSPRVQLIFLFAVGILGNLLAGLFTPASGSLLPLIVEEEQFQQANAYNSARSSLQSILGVVLAGILYAAIPVKPLFLIVGSCYLISGISETFIHYDHHSSGGKLTLKLALGDMKDGFHYVTSQKSLLVLMAAIMFLNFFINPINGNFLPVFIRLDLAKAPAYLLESILTPELWSSIISMLMAVSMLLASLILSSKTPPEKCGRYVARCLAVIAATMIIFTFSYWLFASGNISINAILIILCLFALILGYAISNINIPLNTTLMKIVDRDMLGKVVSITRVISMGLIPIASLMAGAILQYFSPTALLIVCSLGFTATALFVLLNPETKNI